MFLYTLYTLSTYYAIYTPYIEIHTLYMYTAKAIEKFDTGGKGYLTYEEFQGLIASFKLRFTPVQMSEVE